MFRGLTSFQAFVDDIGEGERWYADVPGIDPYFRSKDAGLPAGHVGFRVGGIQSELGVTDRKLAPEGLPTGPAAPTAYWQVDEVAGAFDRLIYLGAKALQPPTELSRGFVIASVIDPFGNVLGLRFDPQFSYPALPDRTEPSLGGEAGVMLRTASGIRRDRREPLDQ